MHDLRFYHRPEDVTLGELAERSGGQLRGDATLTVTTVGAFSDAENGAMCFFEGKAEGAAKISPAATVCVLNEASAEHLPRGVNAIIVERPRSVFSTLATELLRHRGVEDDWPELGAAKIADSAKIARGALICDGAEIGNDSVIGPNVVIGPGVKIGAECRIGAGCVIETALIGNDVQIKPNTVIGGTGFGVIHERSGQKLAPHFGRVVIQDHVSIGANCCIDRGVFGDTVIGEHTRLDNLIQVAHNVQIGRNCTMAAFSGMAGSVRVEDWVQMGGRVGAADHLVIGEGALLAANSALMRDVPPGETWGGTPAKPLRQMLREMSWLSKNAAIRPKKKSD